MTALSVNVNKIALLRNSRDLGIPSVTRAVRIAIENGAEGITVHPRPDKRHIRKSDVYAIRNLLKAEFSHIEFNMEGNPFNSAFYDLVRNAHPEQCTLVPDTRDQLTSDHGWNLDKHGERLRPLIAELKSLGIRVSLFMDDETAPMLQAKEVGADRVELYTGPYAEAFKDGYREFTLRQYAAAAQAALDVGLGINAGHDLSLDNLEPFLTAVPGVQEVSIGHALISDALEMGLATAVQKYVAICHAPRSSKMSPG